MLLLFGKERHHPDVVAHLDVVSLALDSCEGLGFGGLHRHLLHQIPEKEEMNDLLHSLRSHLPPGQFFYGWSAVVIS